MPPEMQMEQAMKTGPKGSCNTEFCASRPKSVQPYDSACEVHKTDVLNEMRIEWAEEFHPWHNFVEQLGQGEDCGPRKKPCDEYGGRDTQFQSGMQSPTHAAHTSNTAAKISMRQ